MARAKFQTLTEQMFYTLLCLKNECCGMDIMDKVRDMTEGRVLIGPGTLYNLLAQFVQEGYITETSASGKRRNYLLTEDGRALLFQETLRLKKQVSDFEEIMSEESR
ncbi:MAG: helix-turn-helix transcriptional regulator [Firmicutes bacterium]|nr:helix-turn-helix transcriptional regulator [Bacillota bacterium]